MLLLRLLLRGRLADTFVAHARCPRLDNSTPTANQHTNHHATAPCWAQGLLDVIVSDDNAPTKVVRLRIVDESGSGGGGGMPPLGGGEDGDDMGQLKAVGGGGDPNVRSQHPCASRARRARCRLAACLHAYVCSVAWRARGTADAFVVSRRAACLQSVTDETLAKLDASYLRDMKLQGVERISKVWAMHFLPARSCIFVVALLLASVGESPQSCCRACVGSRARQQGRPAQAAGARNSAPHASRGRAACLARPCAPLAAGATQVFLRQQKALFPDPSAPTGYRQEDEWVLDTEGVNLMGVRRRPCRARGCVHAAAQAVEPCALPACCMHHHPPADTHTQAQLSHSCMLSLFLSVSLLLSRNLC